MNRKENKLIYRQLRKKKIHVQHVCEVGVYLPETSNILDFIKDGIRATLVEADPDTVTKIKAYFAAYQIQVFPVAVWDENGVIKLSKAAASTFVTQLNASPAIVNDKYKVSLENTFEVPCRKFSEMDDGTIDLISIDIEGSEWYVIKHMVSRPNVISVETHGKYYTNPFIKEIESWMKKENYIIWYKDLSDTVFVKQGFIQPDLSDYLITRIALLNLAWKKFKRNFK